MTICQWLLDTAGDIQNKYLLSYSFIWVMALYIWTLFCPCHCVEQMNCLRFCLNKRFKIKAVFSAHRFNQFLIECWPTNSVLHVSCCFEQISSLSYIMLCVKSFHLCLYSNMFWNVHWTTKTEIYLIFFYPVQTWYQQISFKSVFLWQTSHFKNSWTLIRAPM